MFSKISFIILTWNSGKCLDNCLRSVIATCSSENLKWQIIAVDNGSKDNSNEIIMRGLKEFPRNFAPIFLDRNMGTTYPRNLGINMAEGEVLCVLDSDTEFSEGKITDVLNLLHDNPEIGIVAPQLILPDGSVQVSVKKFPTFLKKISKIPGILLRVPTLQSDFYETFPFRVDTYVDTAISACWFFRKDLVSTVGGFDENIFYSPEDIDFCLRTWEKGYKILYFPKLKILHHTQQITHKKPFSKISLSHFGGLVYYFRKNGCWLSDRKIRKKIEALT